MESFRFDLSEYVKVFHVDKHAGIITNGWGSILEANQAAALLMSVEDRSHLTNKLLVSYVHRKYVREFQEFIRSVIANEAGSSSTMWLRPRGKLPFQANMNVRIVMRNKSLVILRWNIVNENAQVSDSSTTIE